MHPDAPNERRTVVLVTGMSGTGKSTALADLARRGHATLDTDDPGWIRQVAQSGGTTEPLWDLARLRERLDTHRTGALFVAGCVANQGELYERFDAVVLLSAPIDVVLERVRDRGNPFGSTSRDRAAIARDLVEVEPVLRVGATHEIDTTLPAAEVVARLVQIAGAR